MKVNYQLKAIGTVIFSLVFGCVISFDSANAQNRGTAVKAKSSSGKTKSVNKKQPGKRKTNDRDADEKTRTTYINPNDTEIKGPYSVTATEFGITPPIRDMPEVRGTLPPFKGKITVREGEDKVFVNQMIPGVIQQPEEDPLAKRSREEFELLAPQVMPGPSLTFNGILSNDLFTAFGTSSMPPDTVGDVGPNHYVQATNIGVFRVFNKAGAALTATARISTIFSGLPAGNACRVNDDGDPIVNYDPLADRWLISQFMVSSAPNGQCIAVSVTGDPTGAWYAYFFQQPNANFPDYPHWGVWNNAYYCATHDFNAAGTAYIEGSFWAFDRAKMLVGDPTASYIRFARAASYGHLPIDIDGYMPPAATTPAMFFEFQATEYGEAGDGMLSWEFVPNFAAPASSTFTVKPFVALAAFDPRDVGNFVATRNVIEQPQPATLSNQSLDAVGGRNMFRVGFRNLGTLAAPINSYVMNWNVNVSGVVPNAQNVHQGGIRWLEMRRSAAGVMTVFDQGTHAPDPVSGTGRNRFMGSIAQDYLGNIALGFTRSGPGAAQFPDIVWAGRTGGILAAGTMNEGEATMFASTGVQNISNARWGDYSAMVSDPADDCTFWFTSEWRDSAFNGTANNNPFRWSTRIGRFKFPNCTAQPKGQIAAIIKLCNGGAPVSGALVTANAGNFSRMTNAGGTLISNIIAAPNTYTVTANKAPYPPVSTSVTVTNGGTVTANICLGPPPTAAMVSIKGRVMSANGRGIANIRVSMTDQNGNVRTATSNFYGFYQFDEVPAGVTYIFSVSSKLITFQQSEIVMPVNEAIEDLNFIAN